MNIVVTTFYKFFAMTPAQVEEFKAGVETFAARVRGLIITGTEGVNGTVSGASSEIEELKAWLNDYVTKFGVAELLFKDSTCDFHPFRMLKVKVREEIVTLGTPEIVPAAEVNETHLSPAEWDEMLKRPDTVCIDTRNWYETQMGKFKGAIDPKIGDFQDFPKFLAESGIPKDKNILMYCTGGIRCEKATIDARKQGFERVYQLEGGILNYFKERPNSEFEGECFVFDNRVAVDQNLKTSEKFKLCPHCGQPGQTKIDCRRCDSHAVICDECRKKGTQYETCSKNCEYQYQLHPERKGKKQLQGFRAALQTGKFDF